MDVDVLSGLALFGIGIALVLGFEAVERYDSPRLVRLLIDPPGPGWASWLLSISASLFAQKTALAAMGHLAHRKLSVHRGHAIPRGGRARPAMVGTPAHTILVAEVSDPYSVEGSLRLR